MWLEKKNNTLIILDKIFSQMHGLDLILWAVWASLVLSFALLVKYGTLFNKFQLTKKTEIY